VGPSTKHPPDSDATRQVDALLDRALADGASDLHLEPVAGGYEARVRVDGLLREMGRFDPQAGRAMVNRLMVQAQLLSYRVDVPQEGRLTAALPAAGGPVELRLAVMPTTHGLRAAIRMPAEFTQPRRLDDLGLPGPALAAIRRFLSSAAGMFILTGPAGSGKTTLIYAMLEELAHAGGLSIISLEDPVERDIPGVTQIEVRPFGGLTYETALPSMLRQDPQVLALGEVRDARTAQLAMQAAMGGHRLLSTLHAATPGGAIVRLIDMGIEPYQLTSGLFGLCAVRLLRRCDGRGGYAGRLPIAQSVLMDDGLRAAVMDRAPSTQIDALLANRPDHTTLQTSAAHAVERGLTDAAEVGRVLGEA